MSSLQKDFWDFTKATSGNKSCAEVSKFDSDHVDWRGNQMFLKCLRRQRDSGLRLSPEYNSGPHLNYLNNKLQRNRELNMNSISWLVRLDRSLQVSSFHEPRSVFNAFLKKGSKRMGHPLAFPFSSSVLISAPCSRKDYPQTPSLQAALVQPDYTTSVSSVLQSFPSLLHDVTMTLMSSPLGTVWWQWGGATKWHDCGDESSISQWGQLEIYRGGALQGHWWMTGTDLRCDEGWSSSSCWRAVCAHCDGSGGELVFSVQGAGGRWREWRRVGARETGGGTEEWTLPQEESLPLTVRRWEERRKIRFHVLGFEHNASLRSSSPNCVAAVVGGVCHPSNKELLWGSIWLHPPWGMSFHRFTHFCFKTAE